MASIRDSVISTYRKLTHKNPFYNREDAYEEQEKINNWLTYSSFRKTVNMTEKEMIDERLEKLKEEQKVLDGIIPETHYIREYRERLGGPVTGLFLFVRNNGDYTERIIKSIREQTVDELKKSGFTHCEGLQHPKLEEIDMVAKAVNRQNEIDRIYYAVLARLEDRVADLKNRAENGNANVDIELGNIKKEFAKNIKLFEHGTLDDSDKELVEHYIWVH
jgi:anti-sigma28 factor (negative regulator of flagellin synthesis)